MAAMIGVEVGRYYQVSNNFHAYMETLNKVGVPDPGPRDPYDTSEIFPYRMMHRPEDFDRDLQRFMVDPPKKVVFVNSFFYEVAVPMAQAQLLFKLGDRLGALNACGYIMATDWRKACEEWIKRRMLR